MSAAELRKAAEKLRTLALSASNSATWNVSHYGGGEGHPATFIRDSCGTVIATLYAEGHPWSWGNPNRGHDAYYFATVNPAVGLAVAASLDQHAEDHSSYDCRFEPCAMADVARLINGGLA